MDELRKNYRGKTTGEVHVAVYVEGVEREKDKKDKKEEAEKQEERKNEEEEKELRRKKRRRRKRRRITVQQQTNVHKAEHCLFTKNTTCVLNECCKNKHAVEYRI